MELDDAQVCFDRSVPGCCHSGDGGSCDGADDNVGAIDDVHLCGEQWRPNVQRRGHRAKPGRQACGTDEGDPCGTPIVRSEHEARELLRHVRLSSLLTGRDFAGAAEKKAIGVSV